VAARDKVEKVVVFGGGSFGTAMGVALARQKHDMQVGSGGEGVGSELGVACSRQERGMPDSIVHWMLC
jgi:glycerol-3-phosphate dehydrogenase